MRIIENSEQAAADLDKFVDLAASLNLPEPTNRQEVLGLVAGLAAAYKVINGKELDKHSMDKVISKVFSAYGFDSEPLKEGLFKGETIHHKSTDHYADNAENRKLGRVGQEYTKREWDEHKPGIIPGVAAKVAGALLDYPKVTATLLMLLLAGGIYAGSHVLNNKDYSQMHSCVDSICQTYENENDATATGNGATTVHSGYYSNGVYHPTLRRKADKGWKAQQKAIKQYHQSGHDPSAKFDANGRLPGNGSAAKGGGENLRSYIASHAAQNFHNIPESTQKEFANILNESELVQETAKEQEFYYLPGLNEAISLEKPNLFDRLIDIPNNREIAVEQDCFTVGIHPKLDHYIDSMLEDNVPPEEIADSIASDRYWSGLVKNNDIDTLKTYINTRMYGASGLQNRI